MIGEILGNVKVVSEIGEGDTGTVYLAAHVNVGKQFAIRKIAPQLVQNKEYCDRFLKATKGLLPLKHDNIVRVYDVVRKDDDLFLMMEYVDGETLDSVIKKKGALPEKEALAIGKDLLKALNFAHSKGVFHRDIRPSNVFVTKDGRAKIRNFGTVLMAGGARMTKNGKVTGAARYMSPEQIAGSKEINHHHDIYSMGVILYQMLTGQVPFEGETDSEIYEMHTKATPPDMKSVVADIAPALNEIVLKTLEKKPDARYRSCVQLLKYIQAYEKGDDLEKIGEEEAVKAKPGVKQVQEETVEEPEVSKRPARKIGSRAMIAIAVAAVVVIVVGVFATMRFMESKRVKAEYETVLGRVASEKKLEGKEKILKNYLNSHEPSTHTTDAENRLKEIKSLMVERDYKLTVNHPDVLNMSKNLEKAESIVSQYLKKYPDSNHADELEQKVSQIQVLIDDRDYAKLANLSEDDYKARIEAYTSYLTTHPKGKYQKEVNGLFSAIGEKYYDYLKEEVIGCDKAEDWKKCIQACDHYIENLKGSTHLDEVKGIRADITKKEQEKEDLAKLIQEADLKGENYEEAKRVYSSYLETSSDSTDYIKNKIQDELAKLDEKKDWGKTLAYIKNEQNEIGKRINRLKYFIGEEYPGLYREEAKTILHRLEKQEQREKRDRRLAEMQRKEALEENKWNEINATISNHQIGVSDRIDVLKTYMSQNPSGKYAGAATLKLNQLNEERNTWIRIEGIKKKIIPQLKKSGGVHIDNGDNTVLDKRTGLIWCMLDSQDVLDKCLNYESAVKYVSDLKTGGYTNWRLPTPRELAVIYKSEPFFPSLSERWYWTSETLGRASWQKVHVVTSKKERKFSAEHINVMECGVVRAVRE